MPAAQRSESVPHSPDVLSSKSSNCASPIKRSKAGAQDTEWSDVTDPDERRRIQNRVAQRKFRMSPPTQPRNAVLVVSDFLTDNNQDQKPESRKKGRSAKPETRNMLATATVFLTQTTSTQNQNYRACLGAA